MAKKKTKPKKPKAPKTIEPPVYVGIEPPPLVIDRTPSRPAVKPATPKPLTKAYDCMFSSKQLTFYLVEIEGPASSKNAGPFVFNYAPRNVSWKKPVSITEYKTQGNISQPIYFSFAGNKKLVLNDIIFSGENGLLPHDQLNRLQLLQLPAKGTTKLRVFQLLVGNLQDKKFAARSYGKYVLSSVDIVEQFRDPNSGFTLRAKVNLELLEVAQYQVDLGNDLAVPTTIVPTLPAELLATSEAEPAEVGQDRATNEAVGANQVIAYVGNRTSSKEKMWAHLHFEYRNKNETRKQAAERYIKLGIKNGPHFVYPKQILDLITLGPWTYKDKKSDAKKLSELQCYSGLNRDRPGGRKHAGLDYQLPNFKDDAMDGCPITLNVPWSWGGTGDNPDGCFDWEISEPGLDGVVRICHIRNLAQVSNTNNKKASSTKPLNKGGQTNKAIKKKNELTGDSN